MYQVSRRALLGAVATAGAGALAGCSGGLPGDAGDERALSYQLSLDSVDWSLADAVLWEPAGGEDDEPSARERARNEAVRAAAAGERPTTYGYEPVPTDEYVEREGTYYALDVVTTGVKRVERSVLRASILGDVDEVEDPPEHVDFETLPKADQAAVHAAYTAARAREGGGGAPWEVIEEGGYVYRRPADSASELAPDPEHDHVAFHDTLLELSVTGETLAEPAYTGVRIPVAESREAFEAAVEGDLVDARIDETELTREERRILTRTQYQEATPLSEAFRSVIRRLELRELLHVGDDEVPESVNGQHLAYRDGFYRYGLYVNPPD